jgi:GNAT superfamily N-acetyltransferase
MTEMREATGTEQASWFEDWQGRLQDWYDHFTLPAPWSDQQVAERVARQRHQPEPAVFALTERGELVGMLALTAMSQEGQAGAVIQDISIAPPYRRQGHGTAAIGLAEDWSRRHRATAIWATTNPGDAAHAALFARYPVRARQMVKHLEGPTAPPAGVEGRAMSEAEFQDWRDQSVEEYATEIFESGQVAAEPARASAIAQLDQLLPDGLDSAGHSFLCLVAADEVVATNWIGHHRSPGASWVYGVETHEQFRGQGYGRAAMIIGENATLDAGDTLLGLNVFGQNSVAISMYQAMGYLGYDDARSIDL